MEKHGGQNKETRRIEWRSMKARMEKHEDRMEKQEGQNGETWRIEWRIMKDRIEKHEEK